MASLDTYSCSARFGRSTTKVSQLFELLNEFVRSTNSRHENSLMHNVHENYI